MLRPALLVISLAVAGCGGGNDSPTAPTSSPVMAAGVWRYTVTMRSASSSDCVAATVHAQNVGRPVDGDATIIQSGSTLDATVHPPGSTHSCRYDGTASASGVSLSLRTCTYVLVDLQCSDGRFRDLVPTGGTITATMTGGVLNGTSTASYDVFVAGGLTRINTLTTTSDIRAVPR